MRREATIYAGRPISAPAVAKPQHDGSWRAPTNAPACRSDSYHIRRRGAKSFVDDLVLSRGVVLSRADLFCDLLRLSPLTRRFVSFRLTYLRASRTVDGSLSSVGHPVDAKAAFGSASASTLFFSIFSHRMAVDRMSTSHHHQPVPFLRMSHDQIVQRLILRMSHDQIVQRSILRMSHDQIVQRF